MKIQTLIFLGTLHVATAWKRPRKKVQKKQRTKSVPCLDTTSAKEPCDEGSCKKRELRCAKTCGFCSDKKYSQFLSGTSQKATCSRLEIATLRCSHFCKKSKGAEPRCVCKKGYQIGRDEKTCQDIDECSGDKFPCKRNEECTNLPGTFQCSKKPSKPRRSCSLHNYYHSKDCCAPSTNTCGKIRPKLQSNSRIINGIASSEENFPWIAQLNFDGPFNNPFKFCGGAFISDEYVITAYHCFAGFDAMDPYQKRYLRILAGVESGSLADGAFSSSKLKPQEYEVVDVIFPPGAPSPADFKIHFKHDIAIMRVRKVKTDANSFKPIPICLPGGEVPEVGRNCFVIGYGNSKFNGAATENLMEAAVPIVDDKTCEKTYKKYNLNKDEEFIGSVQLCAGYNDGKRDSCQGDSGGPLMCQREKSCEWYLAGVVSYGHECGVTYGVYTEVNAFEEWIIKNTGISNQNPQPPTPRPSTTPTTPRSYSPRTTLRTPQKQPTFYPQMKNPYSLSCRSNAQGAILSITVPGSSPFILLADDSKSYGSSHKTDFKSIITFGVTLHNKIADDKEYWVLSTFYSDLNIFCYRQGSRNMCVENLTGIGWDCKQSSGSWTTGGIISISVNVISKQGK